MKVQVNSEKSPLLGEVDKQYSEQPTSSVQDVAHALATAVGDDRRGKPMMTRLSTGENNLVNFSDSTTGPIVSATKGQLIAPFREAVGPFKLTSNDEYGKVIGVIPLDKSSFPTVTANFQNFINWNILDLQLDLTNVAPFATASGSVQVFYVNDPSNGFILGKNAKEIMLRQATSQNLKAKDSLSLELPTDKLGVPGQPSNMFKMCIPQKVPLFNRYGAIVIAVRATPSIGDGALFTATLSGSIGFYGMTKNIGTANAMRFFTTDFEQIGIRKAEPENYGSDDYIITSHQSIPLPVGTKGTMAFVDHLTLQVHMQDANNNSTTFPLSLRQAEFTTKPEGYEIAVKINNRFTEHMDLPLSVIDFAHKPFEAASIITFPERIQKLEEETDEVRVLRIVNKMVKQDLEKFKINIRNEINSTNRMAQHRK